LTQSGGFESGGRLRKLRLEYAGAIYPAGEVWAGRLARAGLAALGSTETELSAHAKGNPSKVKLARQLQAETTMTLRWIANRLQMGSWT
jgi:hypothetical protein